MEPEIRLKKISDDFESWASSPSFGLGAGHFVKDDNGQYENYPTQCYWQVWQASRRAIVVELPPKGIDSINEGESVAWHNVRNSTIAACKRAIEEAGLKVAP